MMRITTPLLALALGLLLPAVAHAQGTTTPPHAGCRKGCDPCSNPACTCCTCCCSCRSRQLRKLPRLEDPYDPWLEEFKPRNPWVVTPRRMKDPLILFPVETLSVYPEGLYGELVFQRPTELTFKTIKVATPSGKSCFLPSRSQYFPDSINSRSVSIPTAERYP